jgi:hypothetical protein
VDGTDKITATLTGADSNAIVTWSANPSVGTFSPTEGLSTTYTAPSTPPTPATVTITATVVDGSQNATTTVSVTIVSPCTVASVSPSSIYSETGGIYGVIVTGTGFTANDTWTITPAAFNSSSSTSFVSSTQENFELGIGSNTWRPGFVTFTDNQTPSCSGQLGFLGQDKNLLAVNPNTGELFFIDRGAGQVWKFKPDGSADGSWTISSSANTIAVDNTTNDVLIDNGVFDDNGNSVNALVDLPTFYWNDMAVAAKNGLEGFANLEGNSVSFFDITQPGPVANTTATVGAGPWAIAGVTFATSSGNETDFLVFTQEGDTLERYSVASGTTEGTTVVTFKGSLIINGMTPASELSVGNGGWSVIAFDACTPPASCPAAGTAAVFSQYDKLLVFVNIATMTETGRVALTGEPVLITADNPDGLVQVEFQGVSSSTYQNVNPITGELITPPLNATTPILGMGYGLSLDAKEINACSQGTCKVFSNQ